MSELETSLRELRDDLRSSISRPGLGRVADRARQRAVRRRMQVGAITAVVLASVAVPVLRSLPPAERPVADPPASMSYQVDFADAQHGYALGSDCDEPDGSCTFALLATADRGRSWRPRELPAGDGLYENGILLVLGRNRLTFNRIPLGTDKSVELFSSEDGGHTWRNHGSALSTPSPILVGARLERICDSGDANGSCVTGVGAVTGDGRLSPAPAQPPGEIQVVGEVATADGRFWVASQDPATKAWSISLSSDAGVTWVTTPVDMPGEPWPAGAPWSVVEGGGVLYATAFGHIGTGPYGLLTVYRSTDGGTSWTQTWRATPTDLLTAVAGSPVATSTGRLVLYSTTEGTVESEDGTRFAPAARRLLGPVTWTRAGYLAEGEHNEYELSSDGLGWQAFTIRR